MEALLQYALEAYRKHLGGDLVVLSLSLAFEIT